MLDTSLWHIDAVRGRPPHQGKLGGLQAARLALARWAPDFRADLERRVFEVNFPQAPKASFVKRLACRVGLSKPEALPAVRPEILDRMPQALLILTPHQIGRWQWLAKHYRLEGRRERRLDLVELYGLSANEQIAILAELQGSEGFSESVRPVLQSLLSAAHRKDQDLAEHLALSGWTWKESLPQGEQFYGSVLLCDASSGETEDFTTRVHPQTLGWLADRWRDRTEYLDAFADYIDTEITYLVTAKSVSYPRALFRDTKAWPLLADKMPDHVRAWGERLLGTDGLRFYGHFMTMEHFPWLELLDAYDGLHPGRRAEFYAKALDEARHSGIRFENFFAEAARLTGLGQDEVRERLVRDANEDVKLFNIALILQMNDGTPWLLQKIRDDLASASASTLPGA